jgi:hypothetical protein
MNSNGIILGREAWQPHDCFGNSFESHECLQKIKPLETRVPLRGWVPARVG